MAKTPKVADYIRAQLKLCGKKQKDVAKEAGFRAPNVLTMIKQGSTKLPIPRVNALADALQVNRAYLMKLVLAEYMPEVLEAIEEAMGEFPSG